MTMNNNNFSSIIQSFMMNEINSVINKYSNIEPKKLEYVEALISKVDGEFKEELLQDFDKALKLATEIGESDVDNLKINIFLWIKNNSNLELSILADSTYNAMLEKNCGTYKYPLGGKLYVFNDNADVGFVKGQMCSPGIATQAEDLIAGGVKELIHIGLANSSISAKRGKRWTNDAGYRETWGQVLDYRNKGTLCVEMKGVGLLTISKYRKCNASAIYVVTDVLNENAFIY